MIYPVKLDDGDRIGSDGGHSHVDKTLAILGCGSLGTAILSGILSTRSSSKSKASTNGSSFLDGFPTKFIACVRRPESADAVRKQLPEAVKSSVVTVLTCENLRGVQQSDMVMIAVQPQMLATLLEEPGMREALHGKLIISVLAGVTASQIESLLTKDQGWDEPMSKEFHVMRTMPNTACFVRDSTTVIEEPSKSIPSRLVALTEEIFRCVGKVYYVESGKFNVCTALCGSTPAFFAVFLDALVDGAVALGLNHTDALQMAAQTMRGTANMVLDGRQPSTIRYEVASPGGSTMQGLLALERGQIRSTLSDAIGACTNQNGRLGSMAEKDRS